MKIYLFLLLSISSFRNQKVSGNEKIDQGVVAPADLILSVLRVDGETQVHLRLLECDAIVR